MDLFNKEEEKICECNVKTYKYVGFKMSLEICYRCGKFNCTSNYIDDDFIKFLVKHPELVPELIRLKYLIPT
jgi:hypothetical protein